MKKIENEIFAKLETPEGKVFLFSADDWELLIPFCKIFDSSIFLVKSKSHLRNHVISVEHLISESSDLSSLSVPASISSKLENISENLIAACDKKFVFKIMAAVGEKNQPPKKNTVKSKRIDLKPFLEPDYFDDYEPYEI